MIRRTSQTTWFGQTLYTKIVSTVTTISSATKGGNQGPLRILRRPEWVLESGLDRRMEEYSKGSNLPKAPTLSVDPWSELDYVFRLTATVPYLAKWAAQRKFSLAEGWS